MVPWQNQQTSHTTHASNKHPRSLARPSSCRFESFFRSSDETKNFMAAPCAMAPVGTGVKKYCRFKIDENKVFGCQSDLWIIGELQNNRILFKYFSSGIFPNGITKTLIDVINDSTIEEILNFTPRFLEQTEIIHYMRDTHILAVFCNRKFKRVETLTHHHKIFHRISTI